MMLRKSVTIFLMITVICFLIILFDIGGNSNVSNVTHQVPVIQEPLMPVPKQPLSSYGKIAPPAKISIDIIQAEGTQSPLAFISASSDVPVNSGLVAIKIPRINTEPNRTEVLWLSDTSGLVNRKLSYDIGALPVGKYCFTAIFEFTQQSADSEILAVSNSLYLDVRPTKILYSNVSFKDIERIELRDELAERALLELRPELKGAARKMLSSEIMLMEARDPGIIQRRIDRLKVSDPDIARRIMELNRVEADTIDDSALMEQSLKSHPVTGNESPPTASRQEQGRPAYEEPVPIPERFRGE